MSLKAGWYPQDDGSERFWDGQNWTDAVRAPGAEGAAPAPPGATTPGTPTGTPSAGSKGCLYIVGIIVLLGIAVGFTSCGGDSGDGDETNEYAVQSTCKDVVKKQLKNPSTADFDGESQGPTFAAGTVAAQNALGGLVTYSYRCTLDADGETVRLASLTAR